MKTKKMKNIIMTALVFAFMICAFMRIGAIEVNAIVALSGSCGENVEWEYNNGTLIISGTGAMTEYNMGSGFDAPWRVHGENIKSVVIREGVTTIGAYAFRNLEYLESVTIPEGVTSIGYQSFVECTALKSVTFPSTLETSGFQSFFGCTSLETVEFLDGAKEIGDYMFAGCTSVKSVTIPASITNFGNNAFEGCSSLTEVTVSEGLTAIGAKAFYQCRALASVKIPASVTSIGEGAFDYCTGLATVTVPCNWDGSVYTFADTVTVKKTHYFDSEDKCAVCGIRGGYLEGLLWTLDEATGKFTVSGMGRMMIYGSVESYPWYEYISGIKTIVIGEGVVNIGMYAFNNCTALTEITFPKSVTEIGSGVFDGCTALATVNAPCSWQGRAPYNFGALVTVNKAGHSPEEDDGDCTTDINCSECGGVAKKGNDTHTGGEATCEHQASCSECGKAYGEFAEHKPGTDGESCSACGGNHFKVIGGVSYPIRGDVTNTGISLKNLSVGGHAHGYYTAGEGYAIIERTGEDCVVYLHNATVDARGTSGNAIVYSSNTKVIFFGTNNLYGSNGNPAIESYNSEPPIIFEGKADAVLNLYNGCVANHVSVTGGTVNAIQGTSENVALRVEEKLTVAEGAALNVYPAANNYFGFSIWISTNTPISGGGKVTGYVLYSYVDETTDDYKYQAVVYGAISSPCDMNSMEGLLNSFTITEGASLVVSEGHTLDLDSFAEVNIKGDLSVFGTLVCTHNGGTANCTSPAKCDRCTQGYGEIAKDNHNYVGGVYTPANCTEKGVYRYTCQHNTLHYYDEEIPVEADVHSWDSGKVTKEPNCMEDGVKTYTCEHNSAHTRTETLPMEAEAHSWDSGVETTSPTCMSGGVKTYTCQHNGAHTYTENIPANENAHSWIHSEITKEPTCTEEGERTNTCAYNSEHTMKQPIPVEENAHKWDGGQ